jgi:hypothetical protein
MHTRTRRAEFLRYVDRVPVPRLIPIAREPDYRTDKSGRYDHGLFLASAWDHVRVQDRDALNDALEELVTDLPGKVMATSRFTCSRPIMTASSSV